MQTPKPPSPAVYSWCGHLFMSVVGRTGDSRLPFVASVLPRSLTLPLPDPDREDRCPRVAAAKAAPSPSAPLRGWRGGDETDVGVHLSLRVGVTQG